MLQMYKYQMITIFQKGCSFSFLTILQILQKLIYKHPQFIRQNNNLRVRLYHHVPDKKRFNRNFLLSFNLFYVSLSEIYRAMTIRITAPETIHTCIQLPASKSISNRALIINALSNQKTRIENLSDCDDTQVMIKALSGNSSNINVMAAGTAMRFLTAYLCVTEGDWSITGTNRMKQRPISILADALRELGAQINYMEKDGFPPLHISGKKLSGKELTLKGSVSSQYISALLMIAPVLGKGLTLHLTDEIISRPYINLTLQLMKEFGAYGKWITDNTIRIEPQPYYPVPFTVESDWSAASYWYQIATLSTNAEIELTGLFRESYQGDSKVADIFSMLGIETSFNGNGVRLYKTTNSTDRLDYNFVEQPDLAQTLAVTCAMKGIPFRFTGLQSLRIKETDRITALITELGKLGYVLKEQDSSVLYWEGERREPAPNAGINTYEDHRMALAFAPACLILQDIKINHPEVVSKSYPQYWDNLCSAGFEIKEIITEKEQN